MVFVASSFLVFLVFVVYLMVMVVDVGVCPCS
jgi:hypothetical protein